MVHALFVTLLLVPVWDFKSRYEASYQANVCIDAARPLQCVATRPILVVASEAYLTFVLVSMLIELYLHYFRISMKNRLRYLYSVVFRVLVGIYLTAALTIIVIQILFSVLGALVFPFKVMPFITGRLRIVVAAHSRLALTGLAAHTAKIYRKIKEIQVKVRRAVVERGMRAQARLSGRLPPPVLSDMVGRIIAEALDAGGMSTRSVIRIVIIAVLALIVVVAFLFVGISAFTDPTSATAGSINSSMVLGATGAVNKVSESKLLPGGKPNKLASTIAASVTKKINFISRQMEFALKTSKKLEDDDLNEAVEETYEAQKEMYKAHVGAAKLIIEQDKLSRDDRRATIVDIKTTAKQNAVTVAAGAASGPFVPQSVVQNGMPQGPRTPARIGSQPRSRPAQVAATAGGVHNPFVSVKAGGASIPGMGSGSGMPDLPWGSSGLGVSRTSPDDVIPSPPSAPRPLQLSLRTARLASLRPSSLEAADQLHSRPVIPKRISLQVIGGPSGKPPEGGPIS